MKKLLHSEDFLAGLFFMVVGAAFLIGAQNYQFGSAARMGPAYFPSVLGGILLVLGLIIAIFGLRHAAQNPDQHISWVYEPMLYVLGAVALFGFFLNTLGLVVSTIAVVGVSAIAAHDKVWKEIFWVAIGMAIFAVVVFVYGLKLQIPVFPWSK